MIYICEWVEEWYAPGIEVHPFEWFSDDIGYDEEDRVAIAKLEHGDSYHPGLGGHRITAFKTYEEEFAEDDG